MNAHHDETGVAEGATSRESERALTEFRESIATHVAAIQRAGRDHLPTVGRPGETQGQQIKVEIAVGPNREEKAAADYVSVECWDQDYICGKSESGYIHCTVHVCMIVGPVE